MKIFKYAGILAILIEYGALTYFMLATQRLLDISLPISYYSTIDSTRLVFSLSYSIAAILFGLFCLWLMKELKLKRGFLLILVVALIAQIIMSWNPDKGTMSYLHSIPALIVGICMPWLIYYFTQKNKNPTVRRIAQWIILCEVLSLVLFPLSIYLQVPLIAELIAGISFHIWVVLATFEKRNAN